jgi:hypothetical protein
MLELEKLEDLPRFNRFRSLRATFAESETNWRTEVQNKWSEFDR